MVLKNFDAEPLRIGLVVDHPLRDLEGLTLVAHLLAQQGHHAFLIPFYAQNLDAAWLDLDLIVVNYLRPANENFIRYILARGCGVAVLDTEGALRPSIGLTSLAGSAAYLNDSGLGEQVALYMTWGEVMRDALVGSSGIASDRIVTTGCPRFDLAHEPWSTASTEKEIVLINTAFPTVNSRHAKDGREDRQALKDVGFSDDQVDTLMKTYRAVMDDVCDAIQKVTRARPDRRFVLRPHPFEASDIYERRFAHLPNLSIEREGSVLDVLARASSLLHLNCTTAVEAVMCGVPPISLDFANRDEARANAHLPSVISHSATDVDEVLAYIDQGRVVPVSPELRDIRSEQIDRAFGPSDGKSGERVVAALLQGAKRSRPRGPALPVRTRNKLMSAMGRFIGSQTIEKQRQRFQSARSHKMFSLHVVRALLERFADAQGAPNANIEELSGRIYGRRMTLAITPPNHR